MNGEATHVNGEAKSVAQKKVLITRNLQEVLGDDRLDAVLKDRDPKVCTCINNIINVLRNKRFH